jgi:hypothetical protein
MKTPVAALFLACCFLLPTAKAAPEEEAITSHIPRQRVESSVILEVGYSQRRHWLEIKFANGAIYRYVDVPPSVYRDLISAESKAGYYNLNIRKNYRSLRVRPRLKDEAAN